MSQDVPTSDVSQTTATRRERPWYFAIPVTLWVLGAFVVTAFIIGTLAYPVVTALRSIGVPFDANVLNVVLSAIIYVTVLAVVLGVPRLLKLWSSRVPYRRLLGVTRLMTWRDIGVAAIGFVVYLAAWIGVALLLTSFVPGFNVAQKQQTGFSDILSPANAILVFFALVVVAPVAEEMIFRGYLFGTLRRTVSGLMAALIVSVAFASLHLPGAQLQWNVAADVFVMSLVSCYLRAKTGALWASILLHMLKNTLAFILLYVATRSIM